MYTNIALIWKMRLSSGLFWGPHATKQTSKKSSYSAGWVSNIDWITATQQEGKTISGTQGILRSWLLVFPSPTAIVGRK